MTTWVFTHVCWCLSALFRRFGTNNVVSFCRGDLTSLDSTPNEPQSVQFVLQAAAAGSTPSHRVAAAAANDGAPPAILKLMVVYVPTVASLTPSAAATAASAMGGAAGAGGSTRGAVAASLTAGTIALRGTTRQQRRRRPRGSLIRVEGADDHHAGHDGHSDSSGSSDSDDEHHAKSGKPRMTSRKKLAIVKKGCVRACHSWVTSCQGMPPVLLCD